MTSSSAAQHAARLRYTEACIAALRAGEQQPSWESFVERESSASIVARATDQRLVLSATLFRQGGAAAASGNVLTGIGKVAASAALSPGTFLRRSKSQVSREGAGEAVVSMLVNDAHDDRRAFYDQLRAALRSNSIELRLVVGDGPSNEAAQDDPGRVSWAEARPMRRPFVGGRGAATQSGFNIASGTDLIITEHSSKPPIAFGQRIRTRVALWGQIESGDSGKQILTSRTHWYFAADEPSAHAAVDAGMPADRVTAIMNGNIESMARNFAAGVRAALDAPPRS